MNWMLMVTWMFGCGYERYQKRLDNQEFSHWYALRVYMTDEERKTYLKFKTKEERDNYLKKNGLLKLIYGLTILVIIMIFIC